MTNAVEAGSPSGIRPPPQWSLTVEGRDGIGRLVAAEAQETGCRDQVADAYQRFLATNDAVLQACGDWQLRDGQPNDHTDADHDRAAIDRLTELHRAITPTLTSLTAVLDRYRCHEARLTTALDRLHAGDVHWFTSPKVDSYHTTWFEMHEDLLLTLELPRET